MLRAERRLRRLRTWRTADRVLWRRASCLAERCLDAAAFRRAIAACFLDFLDVLAVLAVLAALDPTAALAVRLAGFAVSSAKTMQVIAISNPQGNIFRMLAITINRQFGILLPVVGLRLSLGPLLPISPEHG